MYVSVVFACVRSASWDAVSDIIAACDAAAETALSEADCRAVSREGAFVLASAWARHALQHYLQCQPPAVGELPSEKTMTPTSAAAVELAGGIGAGGVEQEEEVVIEVDDADPLVAVEAIVRRLCAQAAAATTVVATDDY